MRHLLTTIRLALADLWHERVLTACLLLSVSAILGPLLLLFGLKHGIIETMRNRLLRDPASRELFPKEIQNENSFSRDWFTKMEARPDVEFVVPRLDASGDMTIGISTDLEAPVYREDDKATCNVGEPGDPRLALHGCEAPGDGQVVISHSLAERFGVREGATIALLIFRGNGSGGIESVPANAKISAVLPPEATLSDQVWLPLDFLIGLRDYREGLPVPSLGVPGTEGAVSPVFDAVLTLSTASPGENELKELRAKKPNLVDFEPLNAAALKSLTGLEPREGISPTPPAMLWRKRNQIVTKGDLQELRSRLAEIGIGSVVLPLIDPLSVEVRTEGDTGDPAGILNLVILEESETSRESDDKDLPGVRRAFVSAWEKGLFDSGVAPVEDPAARAKPVPFPPVSDPSGATNFFWTAAKALQLMQAADRLGNDSPETEREAGLIVVGIADNSPLPEGRATLTFRGLLGDIEVPVVLTKRPGIPAEIGIAPARAGGVLRRSAEAPIVYSPELKDFIKRSAGFKDFRLFAIGLEDVAPLVREFEDQGIAVYHGADRISQILELDRHLSRLFWLIAAAAAGAGFFGLVASLFASVERKRRDLGVLQLLGMPKRCLFAFPVFQSAVLALCAYGLAHVLFSTFSNLINRQFAAELREGEAFCSLREEHAFIVLGATLGFGLAASFLAAIRACRIQPAEALRAE